MPSALHDVAKLNMTVLELMFENVIPRDTEGFRSFERRIFQAGATAENGKLCRSNADLRKMMAE